MRGKNGIPSGKIKLVFGLIFALHSEKTAAPAEREAKRGKGIPLRAAGAADIQAHSCLRLLTNPGEVRRGREISPSTIIFYGMYVKNAFSGNKCLHLWRKMNSCLSGNSCRQARISAVPPFSLKNRSFSTN